MAAWISSQRRCSWAPRTPSAVRSDRRLPVGQASTPTVAVDAVAAVCVPCGARPGRSTEIPCPCPRGRLQAPVGTDDQAGLLPEQRVEVDTPSRPGPDGGHLWAPGFPYHAQPAAPARYEVGDEIGARMTKPAQEVQMLSLGQAFVETGPGPSGSANSPVAAGLRSASIRRKTPHEHGLRQHSRTRRRPTRTSARSGRSRARDRERRPR